MFKESFDKKQYVSNLDQASFEKLLGLATKEIFFFLDKNFCNQSNGVALGPSLGSTLANSFLCYYEKRL